jgi:putative transport protein
LAVPLGNDRPRGIAWRHNKMMSGSDSVLEFLRGQPVITLFLALAAGYALGRIKVAGFSLGPVAGTLLVSLALGRYGFRISAGAQAVGFALFIFAVGYQAGPRFVEVLRSQGMRYFALALVVAAIGVTTAVIAGKLLALPAGGTAGLLAGAMTTTPTLAAAQEAVRSGVAAIPAGTTPEQIVTTIGTSYAITYIVGLIGVITIVRVLPRIVRIDLAAEARNMDAANRGEGSVQLQARGYRVTRAESFEPTIAELASRIWDGMAVVRLRRSGQWLQPAAAGHLQLGDEVYAYGDAAFFRSGIEQLGDEIPVLSEVELSSTSIHVVVARRDAIGRTLADLDLARRHGLLVVEVRRDGLRLPITRHLQMHRGDILTVVGPAGALTALGEMLGPVEANAIETDMMTFALGIAIGSAVGLLSVRIAGVPLGLGTAGGLLAAGIATGWFNSTRPTVGKFPEAARWILMEFGLLIFMCGVGLQAGSQIIEAFRQAGPALILAAMFVVTLPVIGGYLFGRKILGLHPVLLMGALTGAMTSAPSLSLVTREANSATPALGYTGTYAFANVILTVAGTLVMLL